MFKMEKINIVNIIGELEKFRKSKSFTNIVELKKKILWLVDIGNQPEEKSLFSQAKDFDAWNIKELQFYIINKEITLVERFASFNGKFKDKDMRELRKILFKVF